MEILLMDQNDSKWAKKFKSFMPIFYKFLPLLGLDARLYGNGNRA